MPVKSMWSKKRGSGIHRASIIQGGAVTPWGPHPWPQRFPEHIATYQYLRALRAS